MNSDEFVNDSNPYRQIDDAEVIVRDESKTPFILVWLSLLSYIVACMLPLEFEDIDKPGVWAIILGIFVPMAWIPNPLFFIGWVLALVRNYTLAIAFALVACIWSIAVVFSGDFEGPAQIFWVSSNAILLIACFTGIHHQNEP